MLQEEGGSPLTIERDDAGTPAYMAPEQALATNVGPPADQYAVGVLAYELLSGDVPFHGSDVAMAIMLQHLNEPVPPLRVASRISMPRSAHGSSGSWRSDRKIVLRAQVRPGTRSMRPSPASPARAGTVRAG